MTMPQPEPPAPTPSAEWPTCDSCGSEETMPAAWHNGECVAWMCVPCGKRLPVPPASAPAATAEPESRESLITDALHDSYYRALGNDGRWYCFAWNEGADFICAFPEGASETTEALATFGDDADEAAPEIIRWLESRPAAHSGEQAEDWRDPLACCKRLEEVCTAADASNQGPAMLDLAVLWGAYTAQATELAALRARVDHVTELHDLDDWHEDDGVVLWWRLPVDEPPYCGTPLDTDWPGYHTCWTVIPEPRAALAPHQTTGDER